MTPAPNLWRIQSDLIEMLEAREEAQALLATAEQFRASQGVEHIGADIAREELEAIESGIQKYVAAKLVQVDDLREPLIALAEGVELCKKRAAAETNRAMVLQNRYDRLKDAIKQAMQWLEESGYWKPKQTRKLESPHGSLTLKGNGGAQPVEITDQSILPDDYFRITINMPLKHWMMVVARTEWTGILAGHPDCDRAGVKIGVPEVSKSAVSEALNSPCVECEGAGKKCCNPDEHTRPTDCTERCHTCRYCGGSGKQGVPGARLLPRGESLQVK